MFLKRYGRSKVIVMERLGSYRAAMDLTGNPANAGMRAIAHTGVPKTGRCDGEILGCEHLVYSFVSLTILRTRCQPIESRSLVHVILAARSLGGPCHHSAPAMKGHPFSPTDLFRCFSHA